MRMNLREAVGRPALSTHWVRRWLLGGVLLLLSPLLLPAALVLGYLVRVVASAPHGTERMPDQSAPVQPVLDGPAATDLPAWRPLAPLLRDGVRLALLLLAYGWPALLSFLTLPAGALFLGGPWAGSPAAPWLLAIADGLQPLGLVWLPLMFLLAPLLLLRAAASSTTAQALSPRNLLVLARAAVRRLPLLWLQQLALSLMALPGLAVALVGYPFAAFWMLVAYASLVGSLARTLR